MKTVIEIIMSVGVLFLGFGYFTGKSSDADKAFSAIIPYVLGGVLVASGIALTVVFGLYRLFTG